MKTKYILVVLLGSMFVLALGASTHLSASDGHEHAETSIEKDKNEHEHEHEHEHEKAEPQHEEESGHEQHEEEPAGQNVGPEKGVTSFDEHVGFTLSKEALKTFAVKSLVLQGAGPWTVPNAALLLSGKEKNVYRIRKGVFKRVDILILQKNATAALIRASELAGSDEIAINGVGNIRLAELDVTSGEVGHSH